VRLARQPSTAALAGRAIRCTASAGLVATLAVWLAACTTPQKLEPPKVSIVGLQVVSAEVWVQHLKIRLRLHNPNDRDLPVTAVEYTIEIPASPRTSRARCSGF